MPSARDELLAMYSHFTLDELNKAHHSYTARNDGAGAATVQEAISRYGSVQTDDLARCGKLFEHRNVDPYSGRVSYTYTGDIGAFLAPHAEGAGPITAKFNRDTYAGRNSGFARAYAATQQTVTVRPGEKVMVVKE